MFFKRLSRSRGNSYIDDDYERVPSSADKTSFDPSRNPSKFHSSPTFQSPPSSANPDSKSDDRMFNGRSAQEPASYQSSRNGTSAGNSVAHRTAPNPYPEASPTAANKVDHAAAPDLLTRAFNEAVRPYQDKIDALEQQVADMQMWVDQLEQQRADVHAWIDKRGLRPDVPLEIAKQMDASPDSANSLNAQLDRKITIVNFDLHRLQDDLNDSISSAHFASAMTKFLPDIQRLSHLPTGSRYAYELIIKLVGNLNSHGGLDGSGGSDEEIAEDRRARATFYQRMDNELVSVIRARISEGESWDVSREIKRLEKNGAYLKNLGVDAYFPKSLEAMRQESGFQNGHQNSGHGTPPRYS